jgi:hypothetical protein
MISEAAGLTASVSRGANFGPSSSYHDRPFGTLVHVLRGGGRPSRDAERRAVAGICRAGRHHRHDRVFEMRFN